MGCGNSKSSTPVETLIDFNCTRYKLDPLHWYSVDQKIQKFFIKKKLIYDWNSSIYVYIPLHWSNIVRLRIEYALGLHTIRYDYCRDYQDYISAIEEPDESEVYIFTPY
jgi:hypothetical protein